MWTGHQSLLYFQPAALRRARYGSPLIAVHQQKKAKKIGPDFVSNRIGDFCLEHFSLKLFFLLNFLLLHSLAAQTVIRPPKADMPAEDEIDYGAVTQEQDSEWKYLKGAAHVRTTEMSISADEIDFNSDTSWAYARGHVKLEHYATGDILNADHAEYNIRTEEGKFYAVQGTSPSKILTSPGVLTTANPFYFQALWADRIKNRYVLHKGFITDCKMPKPWWKFNSPKFDVVPGEKAIARNGLLFVHHVPVLYLPYYYRPLGRNPRQSGFLTPNIGNSSLRGYMIGGGYYWAISRSYDMDYILQYFTLRGPASTANFRGKPNDVTDFDFSLYSVQDKGVPTDTAIKQGGTEFEFTGKTQILGFTAKIDYNYLSSFTFRQSFANSYNSALSSEVDSIGFLQRHFNNDLDSLSFVFQRNQLYESAQPLGTPQNDVIIQKLPSAEAFGREQQINNSETLPLFFSFSASAGLVSRQESDAVYGQSQFFTLNTAAMPREDLEPRLSTYFKIGDFTFNPSVKLGLTDYGKDYSTNSTTFITLPSNSCGGYPLCPPTPIAYNVAVQSQNLLRHDADFVLKISAPSIERIFTPPAWLHMGTKLKHVIELNATYEDVAGVAQFNRIIHFDASDTLSNTNQFSIDLTNRLYKKDKAGKVTEYMNWHVTQARYFDPTFGGVVLTGQRNVLLTALELSTYAFVSTPRNYSPVESSIAVNPFAGLSFEYRSAYDPLLHKFIDHAISSNLRYGKYSVTISDTAVTTIPLLVPQANQITFGGAYGSSVRRGWNVGGNITYDLLLDKRLFEFAQVTYNTDCCGFSFQLRRFDFAARDENQYLFSFTLANLGTFGSMQKQDRIF
jgi:LPS-assembly protein